MMAKYGPKSIRRDWRFASAGPAAMKLANTAWAWAHWQQWLFVVKGLNLALFVGAGHQGFLW